MISFLATLLFLGNLLTSPMRTWGNSEFQIVNKSPQYLRIRLHADTPTIDKIEMRDTTFSAIRYNDWPVASMNGEYQLPYKPVLLHLSTDKASVRILSSTESRIAIPPPLPFYDKLIGPDSLLSESNPIPSSTLNTNISSPEEIVHLRYLGQYEGNYLWNAEVHPYFYDKNSGELVIHTDLLVEIRTLNTSQSSTPIPQSEINFIKNIGATSTVKTKARQPAQPSLGKRIQNDSKWKILVIEDGFYHITGNDLRNAGISLLDIDFRTLKLTANGRDVPIFVSGWEDGQFNENDFFEFWGETFKQTFQQKAPDMYQDPFSATNIYWLSWGGPKGQWMGIEQGQIIKSEMQHYIRPYSFYETVHVEKNSYYDRLSSLPIDSLRDFWFFDGGISPGRKHDYPFELHHPDQQVPLQVHARVMMSGRTKVDSIEHDVSVYLNDSYLFSGNWKMQNYKDLQTTNKSQVVAADLIDGINVLTVINNAHSNDYDIVMLNWFDITYPRLYRAEKNFIKFTIPPGYNRGQFIFKIDGFTDKNIQVYKIGQSKIVGGTIEETADLNNFTSLQISFQDQVSSRKTEYVALAPSAKKKPFKILQSNASNLHSQENVADYIIISHPRFYDDPTLDKLVELRQSQGHKVLKINVQDIYNEFSFGHESPYAIKNFLKYAQSHWQSPKLQYVLFVGDGCYRRNTAAKDTLDLIPVFMRQTIKFGAAASDLWYALLDGDDEIPDVHIGRLPVRDQNDLEILLRKIIDYETNPESGNWKNRILLIGGNGGVFRDQALALTQSLPPKVDTKWLFTLKDTKSDNDPFFGGTADLLDYFSQGCAVMTFHGHGGGAIWADNGLLRLDDATRIYNQGKYPFILSMTCFTGAFESPSQNSLSDALLFSEDSGTMAMLGASGVGWIQNGYYLQREILKYMCQHPDATLGEIVDAGKILYYSNYNYPQVISEINQYHLLGDPATKLVLPNQAVKIHLSNALSHAGNKAGFECQFPFTKGRTTVKILDSNRVVLSEKEFAIDDGKISATVMIPKNISTLSGYLQLYGESELGIDRVHGATAFSLSAVSFDSVKVMLADEDSLYLWTKISYDLPLKNIWCNFAGDSLALTGVKNQWFKTEKGVKKSWAGLDIPFIFYVQLENGSVQKSKTYRYYLQKGIDLALKPKSLTLGGERNVQLAVVINNLGDREADGVPVLFEQFDSTANHGIEIGRDTVSVAAYSTCSATVPFSDMPGQKQIQITIDPDNLLNDSDRSNNRMQNKVNINAFNFIPGQGIVINKQKVDTLHFDAHLALTLPSDAMPDLAVLKIQTMNQVSIFEQPDFKWIENTPFYQLSFAVNENRLQNPLSIFVTTPDSVAAGNEMPGLFRFNAGTRKWSKLAGSRENGTWQANLNELGKIAIMQSHDAEPPTFELAVNSQPYIEGKYIGTHPKISIVLQDYNGIDISGENLFLSLDGKNLTPSELGLPDSLQNGNHIMLEINPEFTPGEHILSLKARDCSGNALEAEAMTFKVSKHLDIRMLGNYPNPFKKETTFAYLLMRPCDKLSIRIYTASGRLIRELDPRMAGDDPNPFSADYHEMLWDGTDKDGWEVANGVYFYQMKANSDGESKTVIGKIAKLK